MNEIDRMIQLHKQHRDLVRGAAIRRLPLASGFSADHGVWELAVVEYLADGVSSDEFIQHMLQGDLPARCIRRQIELSVGLDVTVLPCPVRIDAQHIEVGRSMEGYRA